MRIRLFAGFALGVLTAGFAIAQPLPPSVPGEEMPPLNLATPPKNSRGSMPGVVVSQALQAPPESPVQRLPTIPNGSAQTSINGQIEATPSRVWASGEFLLWWNKQQPLITLATGNNIGFLPVLGAPGTNVLVGKMNVRATETPGGRFTVGASLGGANNFGVEASYFFLDTQNRIYSTAGFGPDVYKAIGIPLINPASGDEDVVSLRSQFPRANGDLAAYTSTRVTGWEAILSLDLYEMPGFRFVGLAGFRYFQVNEGLLIQSSSSGEFFDPRQGVLTRRSINTDEVTTSNRFGGGMLGSRTSVAVGALFFDLDTKVSLGSVRQVVQRTGRTDAITDDPAGPIVSTFPGGVFVNPTNAGRFVSNTFAVLPETGMRVGYNFRSARLFFGYNIIYLDKAVRPSDQLDRTVDLNSTITGVPSPIGRPSSTIASTDFWVQGVSFGLEVRY